MENKTKATSINSIFISFFLFLVLDICMKARDFHTTPFFYDYNRETIKGQILKGKKGLAYFK